MVSKSKVKSENYTYCSLHAAVPYNVYHILFHQQNCLETIHSSFSSAAILSKWLFKKTMEMKMADVPVK